MRYLPFLVCVAIVLAGCAGQPSPQAAPTATKIAQAPSPTPTPSPTETPMPTPTATPAPTSTPTKTPTPPPTATPKPTATPTPEPQVYVVVQQISTHAGPGGEEDGYIIPGKRFAILEGSDGWLHIRLAEGAIVWIQASETAYYPEGEVPPPTPTPETPPAAVCEAPHWPDRTPDRKTGIIISYGEPNQRIFPDKPYGIQYDRVTIGAPWYTRRDARIIDIDKQNQIITFQLNDGSTRQRRFTQNTQVIMDAHEWRAGMPMSEARQVGGNFCDLEVGDFASMLHPSEPESANPNPNLTDLWGVFIVQ